MLPQRYRQKIWIGIEQIEFLTTKTQTKETEKNRR